MVEKAQIVVLSFLQHKNVNFLFFPKFVDKKYKFIKFNIHSTKRSYLFAVQLNTL